MNFLETRDFDNQAESFKKQLDALPSQSKWNKFTDTNLNISFKYPQGWTVNQAPKRDAVTIELSLWSRANHVVVNRTRRDQTDLNRQIQSVLEKRHIHNGKADLIFLRDDFVKIQDSKKMNYSMPRYLLIQKDWILDISLINYGNWTSYHYSQKLINILDRALDSIALTIHST